MRNVIFLLLTLALPVAGHAAVTGYEMQATLSTEEGQLTGALVIRWTNRTNRELDRIPIKFSNSSGAGEIVDARVDGRDASLDAMDEDGFEVVLASPLSPGATAELSLGFTSDRRKAGDNLPYTSFTGPWFPMAPAIWDGKLQPEEDELVNFRVELRFPTQFELACSGKILTESEQAGQRIYVTEAEGVSGYGLAYAEDFAVLEAESAGVRIRSFYQEGDIKWGQKLLDYAVDIVASYREEIGFYPQPLIDILPGYPQPWGGYPVTPNVVTIHRGLDRKGDEAEDFARWIMAHEIGHQYWGFGTVLEDPRYTRWFGLSMGIFTDRLYSRARGIDRRQHDDFRWRYLGGVMAGVDTTILQEIEEVERIEWDWNNIVAHGKSFAVLEMLEYVVGEQIFLEIFRETLRRYRGRVVTAEIFQRLCEEVSGRELDWFFHQWYRSNAVLDYRVGDMKSWEEDGERVVEVSILRKGDAVMPLEIALVTAQGETIRRRISGWPLRSTVTFRTSSSPGQVVLDPDRRLALLARAHHQYDPVERAALTLIGLGRSGEAVDWLERIESEGRNETYYWYLLGVGRIYAGDFEHAEEALLRVEPLGGRPGWQRDAARALMRLGNLRDLQGRREEALSIYRRCSELEDTRDSCGEYLEAPYERH